MAVEPAEPAAGQGGRAAEGDQPAGLGTAPFLGTRLAHRSPSSVTVPLSHSAAQSHRSSQCRSVTLPLSHRAAAPLKSQGGSSPDPRGISRTGSTVRRRTAAPGSSMRRRRRSTAIARARPGVLVDDRDRRGQRSAASGTSPSRRRGSSLRPCGHRRRAERRARRRRRRSHASSPAGNRTKSHAWRGRSSPSTISSGIRRAGRGNPPDRALRGHRHRHSRAAGR